MDAGRKSKVRMISYVVCLFFLIPLFSSNLLSQHSPSSDVLMMNSITAERDTLNLVKRNFRNDSTSYAKTKEDLKLNGDAIRQIQFDFMSTNGHHESELKTSPMSKPWMDFQVDLSVPKNLIDTTKVRKPENYIRMLPYSIWTLFGNDPVYDALVFGNMKRLEIMWNLNLEKIEEYGRNLIPNAGRYNPNQTIGGASVVIGNLDFVGFLYDNLNKQGRIRKHNRKHANAWKTYGKAAPALSIEIPETKSEIVEKEEYSVGQPGLYHNLRSLDLIEEKRPNYFERPDYRLLQTPEQRSRFGTFYDPELYALPTDIQKQDSDSIKVQKRKKRKVKKQKIKKNSKDGTNEILQELPNRMEDLYKYIRAKHQQDSIQRKEIFRKDKTDQNVYELEQQQRKLKERQN